MWDNPHSDRLFQFGNKTKPANKVEVLPASGQPGGLGDPNRKGLSGSKVQWYLRYLQQGMTPDEALKKAKEPRPVAQNVAPASKRANNGGDEETPPEASAGTPSVPKAGDKGEKQPPSTCAAPLTGTHTSYAEAAKRVRVAVLPEDYPQVYLSNEELAELEEAIMDDVVTSEWDSAVAFRGIHFRVGYLLIDCLDQDSADWLRAVTPQLRTWKGVPLDTRVGEDIPAAYNVTVFCPRSAERSNEELLMMLGRQNRMEVDSWKVVSRRNDGGGALLVIGID
ncbi:uncharacterized protein LOC122319871 [Drosophila ficusphila]|uniref:uncharacterized protein LOC122319871 n=1 Tax=Drosophila ficusphila TaxID=30025 RepID=UPI001C8AEE6F|nr:uncharacterized protein LOC122319871 [Drosophila ficusphila]